MYQNVVKRRLGFSRSLAALVLLSASIAAAQQFPRLEEENLNGQRVVLPDAAAGKVAVLVLGFSHASQKPTEAWARRTLDTFGKNSGFVLYQLAVLEDAPRFIRGMIIARIKKGVPESQRPTFLPVVHQAEELKKLVAWKKDAEDDAYILVLDRAGKVAYQTHSPTPDTGFATLQSNVTALLK